MAKKPDITTIASGYYSRQALNTNFTNLQNGFDNTLSLDGSTPNSMGADFDVNGNNILNAGQVDVDSLYINGVSLVPGDVNLQTTYLTASYTGDGSTVAYSLTANPQTEANTSVYVDGVYQNKATYSLSGTTVTFSEAPPLNAAIEIVYPTNTDTLNGSDASAITYNQGGTGAQDRTVKAKLQEFVSVKDFGAVGDGVTDDTAAIQAAIDASEVINFSSGVYIVSSSINVSSSVKIYGYGATIKWLDGVDQNIFEVDSNFGCYGIKFIGGTSSSNVDDITFRAISIEPQSADIDRVEIKDCTFEYFKNVGIKVLSYAPSKGTGYKTENGLISGNKFVGHPDQLQAITCFGGENFVISNNIIDGMNSVGILIDAGTSSTTLSNYGRCFKFVVADNIIAMPSADNPSVNYGIACIDTEVLTITGNIISGNSSGGGTGRGIVASIYDLSQQANAPGGGAAYLPIDEDNCRVVISNNSIYNRQVPIRVEGYPAPVITGNNITTNSTGIFVGSETGTVNGVSYSFPTSAEGNANINGNTIVSKSATSVGMELQLKQNFSNDNVFIGTFAKRYQDIGVASLAAQVIRDADQSMQRSGTLVAGTAVSGKVSYTTGETSKSVSLVDGSGNVLERFLDYVPDDYIVVTESPWNGISIQVTAKTNNGFQLNLSSSAPSDGDVTYCIIHSLSFKP